MSLILSIYSLTFLLFLSFPSLLNARSLCDNAHDSSANGNYENVIAKVSLTDFDTNEALIELTYDVAIFSGSINTISFQVFDETYGKFDSRSVTARAFVKGGEELEVDIENFTPSGTDVRLRVCFDKKLATSVSVTFFFRVEDLVCSIENEQVIMASWFGGLSDVGTKHVEIDYVVPASNNSGVGAKAVVPYTSFVVVDRTEEATLIYVPYSPSEIKYGDGTEDIFLELKGSPFAGAPECVINKSSSQWVYVIAGIPAISCFCLMLIGAVQVWYERPLRRGDGGGGSWWRLQLFNANPDIVLRPEGSRVADPTVQAVNESQDDQDDNHPVTTISLNPEEYPAYYNNEPSL